MIRKIGSIMLAYLLILSGFVVKVSASEVEDFVYSTSSSDDTVTITGYTGEDPNVVIPSEIDGKPVTILSSFYCSNLDVIESLTIPESINYISFSDFAVNEIIVDPNNNYFIVDNGILYSKLYTAMYKCTTGISEVTIPETVTSIIGNYCFSGSQITSLTIPETVTRVDGLNNITSLKELTVNAPVSSINCRNCSSLEIINLPNTINFIGTYLDTCAVLKEVNIEEGGVYHSIDGVLYSNNSLIYYPVAKTDTRYVIPDYIVYIEQNDISNPYIQEIVISKDVQYFDSSNFANCPSLDSIIVSEDNPYFTFEKGMLYKEDELVYCMESESTNKIVIPDNITSISSYAFASNSTVEEIVLPDNLESLGSSAFKDCINLKTINIPKNIDSLNESYYNEGFDFYSMSLSYVFEGCNSLENISIDPENTSYVIENGALYNSDYSLLLKYLDKNSESFVVNENTKFVEIEAFRNSSNIKTVDLKNVTDLMYYTFADCTNLENIIYPNVTNFHWGYTFYNCNSLSSVELPDSFTSMEYCFPIFDSCLSLTNIDLNNVSSYVNTYLSNNCPNLTEIIIPKTVEYLSFYANDSKTYFVYDNSSAESAIESINNQITAGTYRYDISEPIKYKVITELTMSNITVDLLKNDFSNTNLTLSATQINEGNDYNAVSNRFDNFDLYDLSIVSNNETVLLDEECEVKMPVSESINSQYCKIYLKDENNNYTDMNALYEDGYMVFKTTKLGMFVITDSEMKDTVLGDVNGDGRITYADAVLILQADSNTQQLTESQKLIADVNSDNKIDYNDAVQILRKDAGLVVDF